MANPGSTPSATDPQELERSIAHDYFCRFHMVVILAAVISSGVLASKGLMELGVSLGYRYPIAVAASYIVFLLLVRVWIWYVSVRSLSRFRSGGGRGFTFGNTSGATNLSFGSRSRGGFSGFRGGDSGGGGASSDWQAGETAALVSQPSTPSASTGGHWWSSIDLGGGGDDNGWLVIVFLIALVACIMGGGVYLVIAAPHILPEAACQVVLAGGLSRVSKEHHHNWMGGVLWSTWIPFVVVMLVAGVLGWEAHRYCPLAPRLIDLLHCR